MADDTGAYVWAGLFTAVAGIMLGVRYNQANMEFGIGYDYDAIAAVLVGGTAIQGGQGSMIRTLAGVAVISVVQVVLLALRLSSGVAVSDRGVDRAFGRDAPHGRCQGAEAEAMSWSRLGDPQFRPYLFLAGTVCLVGASRLGRRTFPQPGDGLLDHAIVCDPGAGGARARPHHADWRVRPVGGRHVRARRMHRGAHRCRSSLGSAWCWRCLPDAGSAWRRASS